MSQWIAMKQDFDEKANAKAQTITHFFPRFFIRTKEIMDELESTCYESPEAAEIGEFISILARGGIVCGKDDTITVPNVMKIVQTIVQPIVDYERFRMQREHESEIKRVHESIRWAEICDLKFQLRKAKEMNQEHNSEIKSMYESLLLNDRTEFYRKTQEMKAEIRDLQLQHELDESSFWERKKVWVHGSGDEWHHMNPLVPRAMRSQFNVGRWTALIFLLSIIHHIIQGVGDKTTRPHAAIVIIVGVVVFGV
jgi:hypothetical protein